MAEFADAERKMRRARSALLRGKPQGRGAFFGQLAMRLELQADPKMKDIMATDGRSLKFNPAMVTAAPIEELIAVVGEECIHCISGHHVRRGKRDPKLWNTAADHPVRHELIDSGFTIPNDAMPEDRFKGMSAERVYSILELEQPPSGGGKDQQQQQSGGQGQGKPQRGKGDQKSPFGGRVDDMPADKPEKGEGEGDGDGEEGGEGDQEQESRGPTREEMEREMRNWQMAAAQAAAAARQQGKLPAFAERYIQELHRPKHDPWVLLREYCKETMNSDLTWCPPNRRFVSQGYYFPSMRTEDAMGEMVCIIDTSGSIDEKTLQLFGGHIKAICEDFKPQRLWVIYADAAVNHVDCFENPDEIKLKPHGGGGTDFRPAFKHIAKKEWPVVVAVYLTDGYGDFGQKAPPDYPVIWAMITDVEAPWGRTIHIKQE